MLCPFVRECLRESIRRKHYFVDKKKCALKRNWSKCRIYIRRRELNASKKSLEEALAAINNRRLLNN